MIKHNLWFEALSGGKAEGRHRAAHTPGPPWVHHHLADVRAHLTSVLAHPSDGISGGHDEEHTNFAHRTQAHEHIQGREQHLGVHPGGGGRGVVGVAVEGRIHHRVGAWASAQHRCTRTVTSLEGMCRSCIDSACAGADRCRHWRNAGVCPSLDAAAADGMAILRPSRGRGDSA